MSASENDVRSAMGKKDQTDNPWPARLECFKKFADKFHERGTKIERRYEDERDANQNEQGLGVGEKRVNLFYSNVTVIKESLYNSLPKPVISRMHTGEFDNEPARVAATIMERGLSYELKCAPWFDASVKAAILDRLVPGMGCLWVNFKGPENGKPESISVDIVYWKDMIFEPQRAWEQVTWAGRKLRVDNEIARKRWGDRAVQDPAKTTSSTVIDDVIMAGKSCVIEMWDKNTRKVIHMTPSGEILTEVPDPYQLTNFFPCPRPLIASPPTSKFLPMIDYYMAQDQYMELDILYARINLIIEAVRVAGVYDASEPKIASMLSGNENKLIPVDNWAMLAEKGGTAGVIDWFPVQEIATVLTHLVSTYEFIKTQLFEVTGMADIVRGSTNQYETAAAQQIKAQFASVRMNGFQRDTAVFVRDTVRIMAELMCQLYSDQKFIQIVGQLPAPDQEFVQAAAGILRNDYLLHYNVDIQTDSLTQADWGLQQEQRMTYMQSLSQFLTSALPVADSNPALAPLLIQMIKFASVGFKGSSELEGTLDQVLDQLQQAAAEPQEPPPPSPEEIKAQAEVTLVQTKTAAAQQESQTKIATMREEAQIRAQERREEAAHKEAMRKADLEFKRITHAMDLEHEAQMFRLKTNQQAVEGVIRQRQAENEFDREQGREDLRTNADIANTAARSKAKDKAKEKEGKTDAS